jgi:DNA-binding MarR family transcriptional regulator/GNAT superfamily N-acetyltransferase
MTEVERVRRFNRTVTERIGALRDDYLARDRPLAESRLLWEAGPDGADVRALRARLNLDAGYLSRLLRSLEQAGLVTVGSSEHDQRVRTVRLTPRGAKEWAVLDDRSDALATSLLEPLGAEQRTTLVEAMDTVHRLLTAALVDVAVVEPGSADAQHCLRSYFAELDTRFDSGFNPSATLPVDLAEMRPPNGTFLLASLRGRPIGCGALKLHGRRPAEIKRVWVDADARGLGVGRRLLRELESAAVANGVRTVRLDTNRALVEAIAMYRSSGYREVDAFNAEPYAHHWFEKRLRK